MVAEDSTELFEPPLSEAEASAKLLLHREQEFALEVDRSNPDVQRQFRDIDEVSLMLAAFPYGKQKEALSELPRIARALSKKLSNSIHWTEGSEEELACHHSRDVRMLACTLSLGGFLDSAYRDWAVKVLQEKAAQSGEMGGVFASNIRKRAEVISKLHVSDVRLPDWPSPREVVARVRGFKKLALFTDERDVLEAVEESRNR